MRCRTWRWALASVSCTWCSAFSSDDRASVARSNIRTGTDKARADASAPRSTRPAVLSGGAAADDSRFDRLVYERVRLGMMSALAVREELTFTELKALFAVSDGNLS